MKFFNLNFKEQACIKLCIKSLLPFLQIDFKTTTFLYKQHSQGTDISTLSQRAHYKKTPSNSVFL